MSDSQHRVALVIDPKFGSRLTELAKRVHVWVSDSPANKETVRQIWDSERNDGSDPLCSGATTFTPTGSSPEESVVAVLDTLEEHHGEYSHDPPISVLEVYGASLDSQVRAEMEALGFTLFQIRADGFTASKP